MFNEIIKYFSCTNYKGTKIRRNTTQQGETQPHNTNIKVSKDSKHYRCMVRKIKKSQVRLM